MSKREITLWFLVSCGYLAVGLTLLAFGSPLHWILDLIAHLRVQYMITLAVLIPVALIARDRPAALVFLGAVLVNAAVVVPWSYVGAKATTLEPALKFVTVNVHSGNRRHEKVLSWLRKEDPDVLLLLEVDADWTRAFMPLTNSHPHFFTHPQNDIFGVAIFSRYPLGRAELVSPGEGYVPSILARIDSPRGAVHLLGMHAIPPSNAEFAALRNDMLSSVPALVRDLPRPVIVAGDLQVATWSTHFRRLLDNANLVDSARGKGLQPTWPMPVPWPGRITVDHVVASDDLVAVARRNGPDIGSDHLPVIVDYAFRE